MCREEFVEDKKTGRMATEYSDIFKDELGTITPVEAKLL